VLLLRVGALAAVLAVASSAGTGCSDDDTADDDATPATVTTTPTAAGDGVAECATARDTVGATEPPTDLVEVAADAGRIADLAYAPEEPLASALAAVSDAAALLTDAARRGDPATVADAATTLGTAYDGLDEVAAELAAAECSSESWGRQVAVAAIELVGAGG
jgi:hypothetical protein